MVMRLHRDHPRVLRHRQDHRRVYTYLNQATECLMRPRRLCDHGRARTRTRIHIHTRLGDRRLKKVLTFLNRSSPRRPTDLRESLRLFRLLTPPSQCP